MFKRSGLKFMLTAAGLLSIALALRLTSTEAGQMTAAERREYYFDSQGKRVSVELVPDQLGLLGREKVSREDIVKAIQPLELKILQEYPGRLFVVSAARPATRAGLLRLGRDVKSRTAKVVRQVALVVTTPPSKEPFFATDDFIAKFKSDVTKEQIAALHRANAVEVVMENPFVKGQFLLRLRPEARLDCFQAARRYRESKLVEYAYPDFIGVYKDQQWIPNDPLFGNQWHHNNTGQSGGTVDADIDTPWAWTITQGAAGTVIAVIENGGFDTGHADLTPNRWVNPGEVAGNGVDDDGNGFVDDVNGWNFEGCTSPTPTGCGNNNLAPANATENHGTSVAGSAAARGNNSLGVTGSCPNCRLMLLRTGYTAADWAKSLAFGYAQTMGAQIITNSWGGGGATPNTVAAITTATTNGRGGLGTVILFAAGNTTADVCTGANQDPRVSLADVIAVSSSSNQDRKVVWAAVGNCIDVLAPSHRGYDATDPYTGTLNATTTDRTGTDGYNNNSPVANCPSAEPADRAYTFCFGGTSFATPETAGVTGLILTVNPGLTRLQVQRLLEDTADKVEDSAGHYATANGFSAPAGTPTHSWGRVNAFEAVRVTAPAAQGGKAGVDVFLRDNRLDWGNTEQPSNTLFEATRGFIPHWESEDIKVDAPPYQPAPTTNAAFEAFTHDNAAASTLNKVYVRVRNRGPVTASSVTVKLHWAFAGAGLPSVPADFWSVFPADSATTTVWHPLGVQTITNLAYSGSSAANTAGDAAQIVSFDFNAPAYDPALPNPDHYCLFAVLDSPQDRALPLSRPTIATDFVPDALTPTDNNVTHRNIKLVDTSDTSELAERFWIGNPTTSDARVTLRYRAPKAWAARVERVSLGEATTVKVEGVTFGRAFTLKPGERRLVTVRVTGPLRGVRGTVVVLQEMRVGERRIMGGLTYRLAPRRTRPIP
jgi:hypothetical protein